MIWFFVIQILLLFLCSHACGTRLGFFLDFIRRHPSIVLPVLVSPWRVIKRAFDVFFGYGQNWAYVGHRRPRNASLDLVGRSPFRIADALAYGALGRCFHSDDPLSL